MTEQERLNGIFKDSIKSLQARINNAILNGRDTKNLKLRLTQIKSIYQNLLNQYSENISGIISDSYDSELGTVDNVLSRYGIKKLRDAPLFKGSVIDVLVRSTVNDMKTSINGSYSNVMSLLWQNQQSILETEKIANAIATGLISGGTPRAVKNEIFQKFQQNLSDGQLIKAGSKWYRPDTYSELLSRTVTRSAQSKAAQDSIMSHGLTLYQVSSHPHDSDICDQYDGRIFSFVPGGKYPVAPDGVLPPYHPNCTHVITPYVEVA